jgi:hypothetical protein
MAAATKVPLTRTSDVRYIVNLIQSGMDGIISARKTTDTSPVSISPVWVPAVIGAAVGVWTSSLSRKRRSGYGVAIGGLVGSALGLGFGVAWASARGAVRKINTVRDARWLEENPIDYA